MSSALLRRAVRWLGLGALVASIGCGGGEPAPPAAASPGQPADPTVASGYRIEAVPGGRLLTIERPWPGADATLRTLLLDRDAPDPGGFDGVPRLRVPVERLATTSTTHVAQVEQVGALDALVAHAQLAYVYSPAVRARANTGQIREIGDGPRLQLEALASARPEAIFLFALGPSDLDILPTLERLGIVPLVNAEFTEATPLARAGWLRLTGVLLGREEEAEAVLSEVRDRYLRLRDLAAAVDRRPSVFTGAPFRGTWWVPGGGTFGALLIRDAGGDYAWADDRRAETHPRDLEVVFTRAVEAEIWLQPGGQVELAELLALDPRLDRLRAVREGQVWAATRRLSPAGGNDFFERGVVRVDEVMADLVHIFHPRLLPDHEPIYHLRLEGSGR